ncbi:MAG: methylaspartate mutase subunit E [Alphaproteobacteria bacterium]|nr:methylaspartate mutase subunit E [Alphaproteobacteria bacterium]
MTSCNASVLLAGVGGDSHSVGLTILRRALRRRGFQVVSLGTQCPIEQIAQRAPGFDLVMVSCMDGHAHHYLGSLAGLRAAHGGAALWYLGGAPSLRFDEAAEQRLRALGFDRVFVRFVDVERVMEIAAGDLVERAPAGGRLDGLVSLRRPSRPLSAAFGEGRLADDAFHRERAEVLAAWSTGRGAADLQDNAKFLGSRRHSVVSRQAEVRRGERPLLIQPRSGVSDLTEQIELFLAFQAAGAGVLSYQVDSLTRNNRYADVARARDQARASGAETLNGFPVINHGVEGLRQVARAVDVPLQTRHSTRDPRLLAEVSYAGGVSSFEGGAICYNIPYYKDYPLTESIRAWQYVDRLTGLYLARFGIALDREYFGTLTATLVPPCLAIATGILESLLALQQGARHVSIGYAEQGHRVQDIAAIRAISPVATRTFRRAGFPDVTIGTIFHQYMAAFPGDPEHGAALIRASATTAALAGATRVLTKTPTEASRIPSVADNLDGLRLVRGGVEEGLRAPTPPDERLIREEQRLIEAQTLAIVDATLRAGGGDVAVGVVRAFEQGLLDIPFAPSVYNRGEVMTARDADGAVRFADTANLPFDEGIQAFHRARIERRRRAEGLGPGELEVLVERDVLQLAREPFAGWPLAGGAMGPGRDRRDAGGAEPLQEGGR